MALHNFHINQGGPSAHSHTRQTLLGQISQEELDHWNHILLLLVLEKLCSLIEIQAVTSRHLLERTPSSWKETLLIHMSGKVLWPCVLKRMKLHLFLSSGFVCYPIHPVHLLCFIASFQTLHPKLHCLACRLWHRSHTEAPGKGAKVSLVRWPLKCWKLPLESNRRPLIAI